MQRHKEKKCECGSYFTQHNSLRKYCSWACEKKYKPRPQISTKKYTIPKVSKKQAELNKIYSKLRIEFLSRPENQICPITKQQTSEVHHKYSGKDRSKYFLDTTTWLAVSRTGHNWIHKNSKQARELQYLY